MAMMRGGMLSADKAAPDRWIIRVGRRFCIAMTVLLWQASFDVCYFIMPVESHFNVVGQGYFGLAVVFLYFENLAVGIVRPYVL